MEQQQPNNSRGFREAVLGRCFVQTCTERFGDGAVEVIRQRERDHLDYDDSETLVHGVPVGQIVTDTEQNGTGTMQPSLEKRIPKMAYYRNNLTALSQRYNLYFAAYENRIFVYRPRSVPKQTLPREPNLIFATKPDLIARRVGGSLDETFHHQINHIATGFLGREEVLVSVYDDGSVFVYYTRPIAEYVDKKLLGCKGSNPVPTYFFADNVGRSAWGIAVHQKSRLIAVSSNRHEVTVFAFGLYRLPEAMSRRRERSDDSHEQAVLRRKRNWRIVIPLGIFGNNIPNIAFWDDDAGLAEKIAAIDVRGVVWILDIWRPRTKAIGIPPRPRRNNTGWGIALLPNDSFLPAQSTTDMLGLDRNDILPGPRTIGGRWIDVDLGLANVRSHPAPPTRQQLQRARPFLFAVGNVHGGQTTPPPPLPGNPAPHLAAQINGLPAVPAPQTPPLPPPPEDDNSSSDDGGGQENDENAEAAPLLTVTNQVVLPMLSGIWADDEDDPWGEDEDPAGEGGNGVEVALVTPDSLSEADEDDQEPEDDEDGLTPMDLAKLYPFEPGIENEGDADSAFIDEYPPQPPRFETVYYPHRGKTYISPRTMAGCLHFVQRARSPNINREQQDAGVLEDFTSRCCILRTDDSDIEMFTVPSKVNHREEGIVFCSNAIGWIDPQVGLMTHCQRLSMVAHVPELSLVVVGSALGRVVLLTPTRSEDGVLCLETPVRRGYRIDWVLPTREDEKARRRPDCGLHGIAVGPVPEGGATGGLLRSDDAPAPSPATRRYRLMMHYRDHRILSYDIGRDERGEELLIF
ncbi:hypothetical protein C8035_v001292 [Colletotrichum spinosum]|uniref:Uncharacterized protein n=1 Tax=Colletotrichum spinosum TaxID=1347390 RepID=A0A4R8Q0D4_9PEZI|nr:hypothetical protein C8035_v001292 [Colletotrichum spinosum]